MKSNNSRAARMKREVRHFSLLSSVWWGTRTASGQRRYDNKADLLKVLCKVRKGMKILEIGCGDGEFTKRLVDTNSLIVATDITPKLLAKGQQSIKAKGVQFLKEDAQDLNFPDNTFDIVCGVSVLHHVDTHKALREAYRVLKKGGQIFFTEPNLLNPNIWLGLHLPWLKKKMDFSPDETALIRWQVEVILEQSGFRKVLVRNYDFLHPLTPDFLINLVDKIGKVFERLPLIKEISGSIVIWAKK